jgi:membrane protein
VYWAAITLGPVLLGMSLSLTSYAALASKGWVGALPGTVNVLLMLIKWVLFSAAIAALFHYVPNTPVRWRHALAGGVFVSIAFEVAKKCLGWYLASVPSYTNIYGAFAVVPILLIWIYLGWVIVLLGAVIAAYGPSLQMKAFHRPNVPGQQFYLAVSILRQLLAARYQSPHGLSAHQLYLQLRTDPLQIEPLLEKMVAMDWVGRLDEPTVARYVLLCDPASTPAAPLLHHMLIDPTLPLTHFWIKSGLGHWVLNDLIT